jgi:hypothetical protein
MILKRSTYAMLRMANRVKGYSPYSRGLIATKLMMIRAKNRRPLSPFFPMIMAYPF